MPRNVTNNRTGDVVNVNDATILDIQDKIIDTITLGAVNADPETPANDYNVWVNNARWFAGGAAQFQAAYQMTLENFRTTEAIKWQDSQRDFLEIFDLNAGGVALEAMADNVIDGLAMRDAAKTPAEALAKLIAAYPDVGRRGKAIRLLRKAYQSGMYAPIGAVSRVGTFNNKNMIKFVNMGSLTMTQKEVVASVFYNLQIGAQNGYGLNHYIKATYGVNIAVERNLNANVNLIDYYFFRRAAGRLAYWIEYAARFHATVEEINAGTGRGARGGMSHKRDADLKFDRIAAAAVVDVGQDGDPIPWRLVNSANYMEISYFTAICCNYQSTDIAKEELAALVMRDIKAALVLADRDAALQILRPIGRLRNIASFWKLVKSRAKGLDLKLPSELFTDVERAAAAAKGVALKPLVP